VAMAVVRAILLDFDGLVVDTETPIFAIWQDLFRRHGRELRLEEWQHALGTSGGFDPVARLAELTARALDREGLQREARDRHWEACETQPLLPGVADLLAAASRLGLKLAVASSSSREWVTSWLDHHGLRPQLGAVCAREDVTRVKPAPDLFLLAAERLGVAPVEAVVFEDSPNGVLAAAAAGMRVVAVRNDVTRPLPLPPCQLVLDTLGGIELGEILRRLSVSPPVEVV
jgi:HAD superfamily hydrolase (TIGR01509 family)